MTQFVPAHRAEQHAAYELGERDGNAGRDQRATYTDPACPPDLRDAYSAGYHNGQAAHSRRMARRRHASHHRQRERTTR